MQHPSLTRNLSSPLFPTYTANFAVHPDISPQHSEANQDHHSRSARRVNTTHLDLKRGAFWRWHTYKALPPDIPPGQEKVPGPSACLERLGGGGQKASPYSVTRLAGFRAVRYPNMLSSKTNGFDTGEVVVDACGHPGMLNSSATA